MGRGVAGRSPGGAPMTVFTLDLGYNSPPLSANDRPHYRVRARITKQIRTTTWVLAKQAKLPTDCAHVTVQLHYRPRDKRRRDPSNLMPTQKACVDGLVDAGLVPDDCQEFVTELVPAIHPAEKGSEGSLWLTISIGDPQ